MPMPTKSRAPRQAGIRVATLLAGAALAGIFGLSACGGGDGGSTSLKWFIAIQPGGSIEKVAETCSKQSGGKYEIDLELLPTDATQQREQLVRRLGAEDDSIDLVGMDVVWTAEFANAGWIEPWSGKDAREVSKGVFPTVLETATFEDSLFGAPFNSNTQLLWYRSDLVKRAPKTWDEMIDVATGLPKAGEIQVQANRYEGFMVWVNAMIESAGGQILSGPEEVSLAPAPTEAALRSIGRLSRSSAAPANYTTSDEDTSRLAFEAGNSAFMVNYTFAYSSAEAESPQIAKKMKAARYPGIEPGRESRPPLGGFNLAVSSFSQKKDLAFEAARCLTSPEQQLTMTELDGLAPARPALYDSKIVRKAFPGFADLVRESIESAGPRPVTPAYQDVTLAVQRSLHPPTKIDPADPKPAADDLRENVSRAARREGLL
jgi:multiple sugar transport system substrate-binding protein